MADNNYCACNSGESKYTIKLNQQGPAGKKGEQGDKGIPGFSPYISVVQSDDENYILRINNEANSYNTPNLFPKDQITTWTNNIEAQVQQNTTDLSKINGNYVTLSTNQEISGRKRFTNAETEFSGVEDTSYWYNEYGKILIKAEYSYAKIRFNSKKRTDGYYDGSSIIFSNTDNRLDYLPNSSSQGGGTLTGNELAVKGDLPKLATTTTAGIVKAQPLYKIDTSKMPEVVIGNNSNDSNTYQKLYVDDVLLPTNGVAVVEEGSNNSRFIAKAYLKAKIENNEASIEGYSLESEHQKYDPKTNSWVTVGHHVTTTPLIATTQRAGFVKPDGTTVTINADGVISAVGEVSQQERADVRARKGNITDYNNRVGSLESTVGEQAQTIATLQENNTRLLELINTLKDKVTALETMIDGGNA